MGAQLTFDPGQNALLDLPGNHKTWEQTSTRPDQSLSNMTGDDDAIRQQVDHWRQGDRPETKNNKGVPPDGSINTPLKQQGTSGNDRLVGTNRSDVFKGGDGNDILIGKGEGDRLLGDSGNDRLVGGGGNDVLTGGKGRDRLIGGGGDDSLEGGRDKDIYVGGSGADTIQIRAKDGSRTLRQADVVKRFEDGQDKLDFKGVSFDEIEISQGTGNLSNHTVIQQQETGKYLLVLENTDHTLITAEDIVGADENRISEEPDGASGDSSTTSPSLSDQEADAPLGAVSDLNANFSTIDFSNELAVQSLGGAAITIGSPAHLCWLSAGILVQSGPDRSEF